MSLSFLQEFSLVCLVLVPWQTVFEEIENRILKRGAIQLFSSLFMQFIRSPQGNDISGKLQN